MEVKETEEQRSNEDNNRDDHPQQQQQQNLNDSTTTTTTTTSSTTTPSKHHHHHHHHDRTPERKRTISRKQSQKDDGTDHWLEATLHSKGDKVDLTEIGLQITHEGGDHKAVTTRRGSTAGGSGGGSNTTKDLDFVFLGVTFIENNKLTNKYQFFSGDKSLVELVLDTTNWLAPINRTYTVRVLKMGKDGKDVRFKVKKGVPEIATIDAVVSQVGEGDE